jgi:L-fuconolactonase
VLELAASYADWWHEVQTQLQHLGAQERAAVLGGNARRVYGLG